MVASMVLPASAQMRDAPLFSSSGQPIPIASDDDVIYQNGNAPDPGLGGAFLIDAVIADDFVLSGNFIVTDVHFVANMALDPPPEPMFYFIFADNNGEPGALISEGVAQNLQTMNIQDFLFEIWFDFEDGVPLDGGVTYWFAMHFTDEFGLALPDPLWVLADVNTGNSPKFSSEFPPQTWIGEAFENDFWFQLTGDDRVVGGEFMSINTTALLLAGLQTSAIWMLPVLAGVAGSAFGILYIKSRRN